MDQETVTYLLIAALLATAVLIALAVVVPRLARRNGEPMPAMPPATPALRLDPLADREIAMTVGPGMTGGGRGHAEVDMGRAVSETAASAIDVSTGLITASGWGRILSDEDARVRRYRRPATVVMIELDGLERLTSRLGEGAADRLIPAVADTVRRLAREADHVARLGQSRFGVLLPETDEVQAINYVERVRRTCDLWLESGAVTLRLAIGWASASGDDNLHDAGRTATERMFAEIHRSARQTGDLVGPAGGEAESRPG